MQAKPLVAIVGRPNVGKSTLFNKLVGKRVSIVDDFEGVTRDRIYCDADWQGYNFTMIDTGGLEVKSDDKMWTHIREQASTAVEIAAAIVFVVDGKAGLTAADAEVAEFLRMGGKPVVVAVNKLDNNEQELMFDFFELGIGDVVGVSAEQSMGTGDLLDAVVELLPKVEESEESDTLNIAVVGKPNAGKSSITNRLLGCNRVIVSDVAGTTRDAVDSSFERNGRKYNIIDTAGMRKKAAVEEGLEQYGVARSLAAVRRCDVAIIVIDALEGITEQDVKVCGFVHEQGKPSVIVMNKWDMVEKDTFTVNKFNAKLAEELKFMDYFIPVYVSALTGLRMDKLLELVERAHDAASRRISTGTLNEVVTDATAASEPPAHNGKRLKIMFVTQVQICPPTFVFFVNDPKLLHFSYLRYLENCLRKSFDFKGTPIKSVIRGRNEDKN